MKSLIKYDSVVIKSKDGKQEVNIPQSELIGINERQGAFGGPNTLTIYTEEGFLILSRDQMRKFVDNVCEALQENCGYQGGFLSTTSRDVIINKTFNIKS